MKLCVFCKHWYFDQATPGYSDMTPGSDFDEGCLKEYWEIENISNESEYREIIRTAEKCEDYSHIED